MEFQDLHDLLHLHSRAVLRGGSGQAAPSNQARAQPDPWQQWNNPHHNQSARVRRYTQPPSNRERDRTPFNERTEGVIGNLGWDATPATLLANSRRVIAILKIKDDEILKLAAM
jgi:hypothetical protein